MSVCGTSGMTKYGECAEPGTQGWQRWATEEEVDAYHASGDLPAHETTAQVPVVVCADHGMHPEIEALLHDATCHQPEGPNGCGPCATPVMEPHDED